jgi:proteasome lid subunit RPN8/RPN11
MLRGQVYRSEQPSFTHTWLNASSQTFSHDCMNSPSGNTAKREISRLGLSAAATDAIRQHVEGAYPEEACGGLLGREVGEGELGILTALPLPNTQATERRCRYLIEAADVLSLERHAGALELDVVGFYHSHPDAPAVPSDIDREHAWPRYVYLIVGVSRHACASWRAWRLAEHRGAFDRIEVRSSDRTSNRAELCRP